mgnify:CR=1 FL=1
MEKLLSYILEGKEVPAGTPGAAAVETEAISPEKGLYEGGMTKGSCAYRTALFVDGGKVDPARSVSAALSAAGGDHGYLFFEAQPRLFRKRLEALYFQSL